MSRLFDPIRVRRTALNRSYNQLVTPRFRPGLLIRLVTGATRGTDFDNRHQAIIEGEKAGLAAIAAIKLKVTEKTATVTNR